MGEKELYQNPFRSRTGYFLVVAVHLYWGVIEWHVNEACVWGRLVLRGVSKGTRDVAFASQS